MFHGKGVISDEDGTDVDSGSRVDQGMLGCLAAGGHHGQRAYSVLAGAAFQSQSSDKERTVSDGASGEKRSRLAGEERFHRQVGVVCAALSRR